MEEAPKKKAADGVGRKVDGSKEPRHDCPVTDCHHGISPNLWLRTPPEKRKYLVCYHCQVTHENRRGHQMKVPKNTDISLQCS